MSEPGPVDVRSQVAEAIAGLDDEKLWEFVEPMGTETVIDEVFREMCRRFQPEKAGGTNTVAQWEIDGRGGEQYQYQVKVANGECDYVKGTPETAQIFLRLSLPNFLRFVTGQIEGTEAFMTGRLRLSGDLILAQSMEKWFT